MMHKLGDHIWASFEDHPNVKSATRTVEGNVIISVGSERNILFTSHMDTVHNKPGRHKLKFFRVSKKNPTQTPGNIVVAAKNSSCLGADDGTGVWLMMNMIEAGIPGDYGFFVDEEIGCQGSAPFSNNIEENRYTHVISFDRKGYNDVVEVQCGYETASEELGEALGKALGFNTSKCDPIGSLTDSENFTEVASECTNISVGYFYQHTSNEIQDLNFALKLLDKLLNLDWDSLPAVRPLGCDAYGMGTTGWLNVGYNRVTSSPSQISGTTPSQNRPLTKADLFDLLMDERPKVFAYLYMKGVTQAEIDNAVRQYDNLSHNKRIAEDQSLVL